MPIEELNPKYFLFGTKGPKPKHYAWFQTSLSYLDPYFNILRTLRIKEHMILKSSYMTLKLHGYEVLMDLNATSTCNMHQPNP
jgi:hypothetical protein